MDGLGRQHSNTDKDKTVCYGRLTSGGCSVGDDLDLFALRRERFAEPSDDIAELFSMRSAHFTSTNF
jgi:hypothetical protein